MTARPLQGPCHTCSVMTALFSTRCRFRLGLRFTLIHESPKTHAEHFCARCAAWLSTQLEPADESVWVFMHHNPVPIGIAPMDKIMLLDADRLTDAVAPHRNRIRHFFLGHCHLLLTGSLHGIPVSAPRGTNQRGLAGLWCHTAPVVSRAGRSLQGHFRHANNDARPHGQVWVRGRDRGGIEPGLCRTGPHDDGATNIRNGPTEFAFLQPVADGRQSVPSQEALFYRTARPSAARHTEVFRQRMTKQSQGSPVLRLPWPEGGLPSGTRFMSNAIHGTPSSPTAPYRNKAANSSQHLNGRSEPLPRQNLLGAPVAIFEKRMRLPARLENGFSGQSLSVRTWIDFHNQ